jgi:HrpA-like RNA helicase
VAAAAAHQVVIVAGETGCGKTTQVPQYLLEEAWASGRPARIVCTQPRRISAVSVAERVAAERGERCGDASGAVGYSIRLEARAGPRTALLFCTNGVLLRKLTQAAGGARDALAGVTHIVVDEIHERDLFADFLLIVLREVLPARPTLRLVLMSATLNEHLFSDYFSGAPVIRVPGFTHPVQEFHLEDILPAVGYGPPGGAASAPGPPRPPAGADSAAAVAAVEAAIEAAFLRGDDAACEELLEAATPAGGHPGLVNVAHRATGATALHAAAGKGREDVAFALVGVGGDLAAQARDGSTPIDWARRFGHAALADALDACGADAAAAHGAAASALTLSAYQLKADPDDVDLDLIEKVIVRIHTGRPGHGDIAPGEPGAVLVFLPGWDEISRLRDRLAAHPALARTALLLPLHSMVPPAEQRRVFLRAPKGMRKIVMATNIAETAVTVDDVVFVVDSGRHKEKSYDAYTAVSTLQAAWVSQASARQRRGRAGRCRPGECYRLYSSARLAALPPFQLPELQRSPLEELALQVKLLQATGIDSAAAGTGPEAAALGAAAASGPGSTAAFLARAVEPPLGPAVEAAVTLLTDIGALAEKERLTRLGRHLAALPLHPRVGKMLLFASLFDCADPALTVAASGAARSPFLTPSDPTARRAADASRRAFADAAGGGSDHLAVVAAFAAWQAARGGGGERQLCAQQCLSMGTLNMIAGLRSQLAQALAARGMPMASTHASSPGLVRAVLGAGMYPLVGTLLPSSSHAKPTLATLRGEKVRIHPSSVNGRGAGGPEPAPGEAPRVLAFDEVVRGEALTFVRESTALAPHVLLLVAGRLALVEDMVAVEEEGDDEDEDDDMETEVRMVASADTAILVVDDWLRFRVPIEAAAQLCTLRLRLAGAFSARVTKAGEPLPPQLAAAVAAATAMLDAETGGEELPPLPRAGGGGQGFDRGGGFGGGRGRGGYQGGGGGGYQGAGGGGGYQGRGGGRFGGGGGRQGGGVPAPRPVGGQAPGGGGGRGRGRHTKFT